MPYKERPIQKVYFSIGEVAEMFDVNPSLIRFYEKEFEELNPRKSKKGNRMYTQSDIDKFKSIIALIKDKGLTIQGAKNHLSDNSKKEFDKQSVISKLENIRDFLVQIRNQL